MTMSIRCRGLLLGSLILATTAVAGCGATGPQTEYGRTRGTSLNGTKVFGDLLRRRGHEVRSAVRLTDSVSIWADVIVRFAANPGPLSQDEAEWYVDWFLGGENRSLIYVVRDSDSEPEYWSQVLRQLDANDAERREDAEQRKTSAGRWISKLPPNVSEAADSQQWFAVDQAVGTPKVCTTLEGPWSDGIDAAKAEIPLHESIKAGQPEERVLLSAEGKTIATDWIVDEDDESRVLVLANASFLVNYGLTNPARRPLAERTADWIGEEPLRIAFVEGGFPLSDAEPGSRGLIGWITDIPAFRWVAFHFVLFGVLACLARSPILGRPSPEPRRSTDRPAAHAEALGKLLERGRNAEAARNLLADYRRWRFPTTPREPHSGGAG